MTNQKQPRDECDYEFEQYQEGETKSFPAVNELQMGYHLFGNVFVTHESVSRRPSGACYECQSCTEEKRNHCQVPKSFKDKWGFGNYGEMLEC